MRKGLFLKLLVPAVALALVATPAYAAKKKPIKVGLLYALSGLAAVYTKGTVIGHEIAAEEINAKGGVLGRKIKFVTRDNKLKPGIAVKEFRRLVTKDKVDFVMGIISSGVALAVSQVAKEMKVLFVDTIAQTAALTGEQGHQYVIRTNTNSTVIGRTAALAAAKREWKNYYFIGPDYEWGHRVNSDFWEFLQTKKAGVKKMGDLWPKLGERDYSAHITAMLNAKPDAVFSSLWGGDLIAFIKQASAYGFFDKIQYISTGGGDLDILRVRLEMNRVFSGSCETAREELDAGEEDPGLGGLDGRLEVLGQPPVSIEPGERALDDPSAGQELEALHARGTVDDLQRPAADPLQCALELGPGIGAVGEDVAQAGKVAGDGGEHRRRAVAVLDLGAVDHDRDQQAAGVGEDVTLAALDFLSGVEAPDTAAFRGFYALTVDDTGRRAGRAALGLARRDQQLPVDLGPGAVVPPEIKVALHRRAWREVPGQHAPWTAATQ